MQKAGKEIEKMRSRMKLYAFIAYGFLFLMALLSSLGDAFIYIFSGACVFFVFLALQNWWEVAKTEPKIIFDRPRYSSTVRNAPDLSSFISKLFNKGPNRSHTNPANGEQRKFFAIIVVIALIAFSFLLVIIVSVNSPQENYAISDTKLQADDFYARSNFDSAAMLYRRAVAEDGQYADGYYGLGNVKYELREYDSALIYYEKALALNPENLDARYGLGLVYFSQENYGRSIAETEKILDQTDSYVNAYLLIGDDYYFQQKYDSAILYYEPAYERGARSKDLANIMAYIYDVQGKTSQAISFYEETLEYDTTMVEVYKRLGELIPGPQGDFYRARGSAQ